MAEQVQPLCERLVQAVTVIMEPGSPQELRLEALRFCEDFKEKCPVCVPCGLQLAERSRPALIRHFGLQVLEHVVKFRWNNMAREEKLCLKNSVMSLIANGIRPTLEEEGHIKDVLARIVVEMIKREWPQHWPDMLTELESLTKNGGVQTELVMFILLRLAEDVVTFQTLPTQRRRDIQTTMTQSMDKLFTFMLGILGDGVHRYRQLKGDLTQKDKCQEMCRVALAALNTLAGYVDWVSVSHITAEDCKLLQMLCLLLEEDDLQVEAAEALLIAVGRKGKAESREPLLILFGDNPMHYIMTAAQKAHGEGLQERRYVFLKRLCQVLCALGGQLCALASSPDIKVEIPVTFGKYLHSLLSFTAHPSQFLRSSTMMTWGSLFRHELLAKDPALLGIVPEFLRVCMSNAAKVGFPSRGDSPSCEFSRLDFDNDEDFNNFFNLHKPLLGDLMRECCRLDPHTSFRLAADWLQFQMSTPPDPATQNVAPGDGLCRQSPVYVQWDAMTFFCECVINHILKVLPSEELPVSRGVELLQRVLSYDTTDSTILSCVLTSLSALFPFGRYTAGLVPTALDKLFSAIAIELDHKGPRTRAVRNLRRHTCSSLIRICRDFPELVMPHLDLLFARARLLLQEPGLAPMERCAVLEAQVLLSNHFRDYEKQRAFLGQLLGPVLAHWESEEVQRAVSSPRDLISYVGREVLRGAQEEEELYQRRRSQLCFCLHAVEGVVRRARWPSDPKEAESGGFLVGYSPAGSPVYRNPCSEQVLKTLPPVCSLLRAFNALYSPELVQEMGDVYAKTLDMIEADKKCVTGTLEPLLEVPVYRSAQERVQAFFSSVSDSCHQILGVMGQTLRQDFYAIPGLETLLVNSAFSNLGSLPDFRLKLLLRFFVKPFVLSCPPEKYCDLLHPIMAPLLTFLHQRLSHKWLVSTEDYAELNAETSEILEIELVRLLTREMVDLLIACCIAKKRVDQSASTSGADGVPGAARNEAEDEEMMVLDGASAGSLELTDLGKTLMASEEVSAALLTSAFSPLLWLDTPACYKAASQLCWPLLKQVLPGSLRPEAAVCFFSNVLSALQTHGQHEGCGGALVTLSFQMYEALRPRYPDLRAVMERVPDVQPEALETFDSKLLHLVEKQTEKRRKEQFRRLVHGCVGKPLGEQFRKEVHIRNLPSLFQKKPKPSPDADAILIGCDAALPSLFQP